MNIPKISLVVPIYNAEKYLDQCIQSIICQTLNDIEIILINDGSSDSSRKICEDYSIKDKRIKVIHKINHGVSEARNDGIKLANGKYVMFLDADDWIDINTCEEIYNEAQKHDNDIVFWLRVYEYENKSVYQKSIFENDIIFEFDSLKKLQLRMCGLGDDELMQPTKTDAFGSCWGKLYKLEIVKHNKIWFVDHDKVGSEDVLFNFMTFQQAKSVKFINRFFNHYRKYTPDSLTKTHYNLLYSRFFNLFEQMEKFIIQKNLDSSYIDNLSNRIALSIINISLSLTHPKSELSIVKKIKEIQIVLNDYKFIKAVKHLKTRDMPFYWKLFFMFCRNKNAMVVYLFASLMRNIRHRVVF